MNYSGHEGLSSSQSLAEQAQLLATLTRSLAHCCTAKEVEIFARYELSASEGHLLLAVAEAGNLSPSVAAVNLGVGRSRLTPLAQSLVEKGFLKRSESEADRRMRDLELTEAGLDVARQASQFRLDFHAKLLGGVPDPMRERLIESLHVLYQRMMDVRCSVFYPPANGNGARTAEASRR